MPPLPQANPSFEDRIAPLTNAYTSVFARLVLRRYRPFVIGITGSVGKTTTKEIIAGVLMHDAVRPHLGLVWKAQGNMNARKGFAQAVLGYPALPTSPRQWLLRLATMPLRTARVLAAGPYPRLLVLEYALGKISSVRLSVGIARPNVAIVTAVGPAHLDRYGTIERVIADKGTLVAAVPADGLVLLGADNEHAVSMASLSRAAVELIPGRGREFAEAAARRVARHLGVPEGAVDRALASGVEVQRRQHLTEFGDIRVFDDSYNANPLSMAYGLETFARTARPGERRVAVLGGMAELGSESARYHAEVAGIARGAADVLIGVGDLAREYDADQWFPSSMACAAALPGLLHPGDYIFVKGSASVELSTVVRTLAASRHD